MHRRKAEYDEAVAYYQQALALGKQIGEFRSQLNSLMGLARAYRAQDDMGNACKYVKAYLTLQDSHPFFRDHPFGQQMREEFAEWGCDGV